MIELYISSLSEHTNDLIENVLVSNKTKPHKLNTIAKIKRNEKVIKEALEWFISNDFIPKVHNGFLTLTFDYGLAYYPTTSTWRDNHREVKGKGFGEFAQYLVSRYSEDLSPTTPWD